MVSLAFEFSRSGALSELSNCSSGAVVRTAWQAVESDQASLIIEDSQKVVDDRRLLIRLFEHLFRNAIEHAGPECTVRVGVLTDGFYVDDDGPGLPEAVRENAVQADYSTRGAGGLGLAIVQAVTRAHGGHLIITDASCGGARFELSGFDVPPPAHASPLE